MTIEQIVQIQKEERGKKEKVPVLQYAEEKKTGGLAVRGDPGSKNRGVI